MRSRCKATLVGVAFAAVLAGCTNGDRSTTCAEPQLTYDTFGEPFMVDWCRGCHSAQLTMTMRQGAPVSINFDTLQEIRAQSLMISMSVSRATMPPEGGPSSGDRQLLVEWLGCGAP